MKQEQQLFLMNSKQWDFVKTFYWENYFTEEKMESVISNKNAKVSVNEKL